MDNHQAFQFDPQYEKYSTAAFARDYAPRFNRGLSLRKSVLIALGVGTVLGTSLWMVIR